MFGKCPRCQEQIPTTLTAYSLSATEHLNRFSVSALALACPHCRTILGVSPDPVAFARDVAATVLEQMQGK